MECGESWSGRRTGGGTAEAQAGPEGETGVRLWRCRRQDAVKQTELSRAVVLWSLANHTSDTSLVVVFF